MSRKLLILTLAMFVNLAFAQTLVNDATINAGETFTMTSGNSYLLDGFVFVEEGATLIIEPGTIVFGKEAPSTGDNASALIIARGAKLIANGTAANPIIFTAESDDIGNPNDLGPEDRGLWGGLLLLGKATTNRGVEGQVEGIPSGELRAAYGGSDDHDNSGVLRYLSIRHGGAELGPGDEINGLTLAAVGDATVVEYIEVYANNDDGFEWFGGTVNSRYLVSAFNADDCFDWDEGFRGKNQFWFGIQSKDKGGRIGEHDGGTVQETAEPFSLAQVVNATYIGAGAGTPPQGDGAEVLIFRDNSGGIYQNSIFTEYNGGNGGKVVTIEIAEGNTSTRLANGELLIRNNLFWHLAAGDTFADIASQDVVREHLQNNNNQIANPELNAISRDNDGGLDPRPSIHGAGATGAELMSDNYFLPASYRGAFEPRAALWTNGWTALYDNGHTVLGAAHGRMIPHVTRIGGGFKTNVILSNTSGSTQQVILHPFAVDGTPAASLVVTLNAGTTKTVDSVVLFGGEVSHFSVSGSEWIQTSVGYLADGVTGASAHVNSNQPTGRTFVIYPGEADVVFDGMALVNLGDSNASVSVSAYDASGAMLQSQSLSEALAPNAKLLAVFGDIRQGAAKLVVTSTADAAVVMLRGSLGGQTPAFLYQTAPIVDP